MKTSTFLLSSVCSSISLLISPPMAAATWYVDASVEKSGDGTGWEVAFKTIQEGIDSAVHGDTVTVAEGTYVENIKFKGKNIILRSTDPLGTYTVANTVIDGNRAGPVVSFEGTETAVCNLSGLTVRNGKAPDGGGICGGTLEDPTKATIHNSVITGNSAEWRGGGLAYCSGTIQNNAITENSSDWAGGGLASCNGTIQDNVISGNSADDGGGLCFCDGAILNNTVTGNWASTGGGVLCCDGLIQGNTIVGNSAVDYGGGGLSFCRGTIQNNKVRGNSGRWGGGLSGCHGSILNNTIVANRATDEGGGLSFCLGLVLNCIVWGNEAAGSGDQMDEWSAPSFSCVQDWSGGGEGNTAEDPCFVDAATGDHHLRPGSPCIDAGTNFYWFAWPQRDLDGNSRLHDLRLDMGCYEYASCRDSDGDLLSDSDEAALGTDPFDDDTDGDGLRDGLEPLRGSDALTPTPPRVVHVPSEVGTIQKSLCLAVEGDEIVVAPGTYSENLCFCGANVVLRSCDPEDPSVVGSTVIDGKGTGSVVCFTGSEGEACALSGFTITGGKAPSGGGVRGGIPDLCSSQATVQRSLITRNSAYWGGGGLAYCDGALLNNTITGNSAQWGGGLSDCHGNIQNNSITKNSAEKGGGLTSCDGAIHNNFIAGNSAQRFGGGLLDSYGTILGNTIAGNSARSNGGGLMWCGGTVGNNTITGNRAGSVGGGLYMCRGTILNCIVWGNSAPSRAQIYESGQPEWCCIQDWRWGGEGNMAPPSAGFVDADGPDDSPDTWEDNNYRLSPDSPCVDVGKNEDWMWDAVDLDGNPRIWGSTVDMGAYEYGSWPFRIVRVVSLMDGEARLTWNSRPGDIYTVWSCIDLLERLWNEEARIPSHGESTTWIDPDTASTRKFYRIEIE